MTSLRFAPFVFLCFTATEAIAQPAHNLCVPEAIGVPTREGPPRWLAWTGTTGAVDTALDDPRWLGSTGHSFELGAAKSPLQARALYSTTGAQEYLHLSFVVDLDGLQAGSQSTPRDLFLGFRRANVNNGETGYIFQFHLTGTNAGIVAPTHCAKFNECSEVGTTPKDYWRVFVDHNQTGTCTATGHNGHKYERFTGATVADPPITWMTSAGAPDQDAVRYWKLAASATEPFQNRWAIQLRLPIVAANQPITAGIERGSRFWYQATAQLTGGGGGPYATVGWFPRELTTPICPMTSLADFLIHEELGSVDATNCPLCSPDKFSNLTTSGGIPASCDGGISIDYDNVGAVFNPPGGTDFSMVSPTNQFKAVTVTGVAAPNVVVAQPRNTTNTAISAPLMARFRLAAWGSAPWSNPADTGQWKDMRGAEGGVCGAGTAPNCTNIVIPPSTSASGGRAAITFPWQIGTGPLNASEYCLYGLTPPAATNTACSAPGTAGCASGEVRATGTGGTFPCVSPIYQYDQCMLVELSAPNGTANFVKQSTWNNMTFSQLSVMSREALIDARTLPKGPKQQYQDIYLIAMPRNMRVQLPAPVSDGAQYIRQLAFDRAQKISKTYSEDFAKLTPAQLKLLVDKLQRQMPSPNHNPSPLEKKLGENYLRVQLARVISPQVDYDRIGRLLEIATKQGTAAQLTEEIVKAVGPSEAADVVPTLDIYPFYQHLGVGDVYMPMSSFTVFLSHEGSMTGMKWLIDGADKVGENIYHLRIPTGFARKIRVRAEAIEPASGALLTPQNPKWPCSGGCACGGGAKNCGLVSILGNTAPGLIAGVFVVARRRKKPAKKSAQQPAQESTTPPADPS